MDAIWRHKSLPYQIDYGMATRVSREIQLFLMINVFFYVDKLNIVTSLDFILINTYGDFLPFCLVLFFDCHYINDKNFFFVYKVPRWSLCAYI